MTIAIGLSAVNTGNNLVYIIDSALLSYMLVSGVFGRRNIFGLDAEISFPDDLFAGTETLAELKVRNRGKWMPSFLITVEVSGTERFFPCIASNSTVGAPLPVVFNKRGTAEVSWILIASNFPFNFFKRFRRIEKKTVVTVYPKPIQCSLSSLYESGTRFKGEKDANRPGADSDILSIRDYVPGDPPKYISWKSTAKTGRLKIKELSAIERSQVTIDFDGMEKNDLERVLSCTTHIVLGLFRSGIPVGLRIGGEVLKPSLSASHRRMVLTRLALYGQN